MDDLYAYCESMLLHNWVVFVEICVKIDGCGK